ncbi:MAG: cyclic nucleotide-binding domain-containing protein [Deltaproteobacteria bacterium]|nr:cyclic nucleotide-binding domain-containing protein [Deltaproteobacteria bacterium]
MSDKLRKLKDDAAGLVVKGKLDKALEVYKVVLEQDPNDLTAQLKCGDILRKLDRGAEAIGSYTKVAEVYGADGLLLKAIAACKLILEIDPQHTATQAMLADLYAKKTGRAATALPAGFTAPPPVAAPPPLPRAAGDEIPTVSDEEVVVVEAETPPPPELPTIPLFSDLPKNAFIQLLEQMRMRSTLPGEVVIREGDVDTSMFIISHGKVKITKTSEKGSEVILAHLGDGTFFGEMALLSEAPRSASVIAAEETLLFEVSRDVLDQVVANFPSVKNILLKFYRQRLLSNLMATSPIFKPLDGEQRKSLVEKFKSREVPANEKILEEGQKGDGLYMLLAGKVEVAKKTDGKKQVLAHLKEGDVFGEMSLLTNQPVSASIKTIRKSIILKLPRKTFSEIVSTHPQLLAHISELSEERAKTTQAILAGQLKFGDDGLVLM